MFPSLQLVIEAEKLFSYLLNIFKSDFVNIHPTGALNFPELIKGGGQTKEGEGGRGGGVNSVNVPRRKQREGRWAKARQT